ncbi:hypothetical protein EV363DRAFT_1140992, partial [Boletus edulis]
QPMPIPPYLFAIASGNVAFQVMGEEWCVGRTVRRGTSSTKMRPVEERPCRFLAAKEEITRNYKFGVYDLLALPPVFPYGEGMSSA